MKKTLLFICLGVPVMALGSKAAAGTYFVDVDHGMDRNSGIAVTSAWAHLPGTVGFRGPGWTTLVDGDTLYVRGGSVNNCQVLFNSTHYNPTGSLDSVQIRSGDVIGWGSGRAIFDGQNTRT